jgi:hypothetical protein
MFLALTHGDGFGNIQQVHARMRIFRRDCLMAEVEAQTVRSGLADDPGKHQSRRRKSRSGHFT